MKRKYLALLLVVALLGGIFAACAAPVAEPPTSPTPVEPAPTPETPKEVDPTPPPADLPASTDLEAALFHFSEALFREVLLSGEENPVISPLSAYYALAMAALGAAGETRAEFEAVLGRDPAVLATELRALSEALTNTAGSTELNIAGSVWTAEDFTIAAAFEQAMADYFDAPAKSRDFGAEATVDEINAWVSERTEGLIEELIQDIGDDEVMLLINTLYFSAKWAEAFNPMTELIGRFHPEIGDPVEVPFLSTRLGTFSVARTDAYEAAMLPYDDGRMGLLLVRPTDGTSIREFAAAQDLAELIANLATRDEVWVRMPRLDLEFVVELSKFLQAMGLQEAFDENLADLSGLLEEDAPLHISRVLQKVRFLVDEEGTEAAAATAVGVTATSAPLNPLELNFNTPYLYIIYDLETGTPLFMGVLDNPF